MSGQLSRPAAPDATRLIEATGTILTQDAAYEVRLSRLARELCEQVGLASVAFDSYDPTESRPFVRIAHPPQREDAIEESLATTNPVAVQQFVASMLERREPLVLEGEAFLSTTGPLMRAAFVELGAQTLVAFPLIHQDDVLGALWCSSRDSADVAVASMEPIRQLLPYLAIFLRAAINEATARSAYEKLMIAHDRLEESQTALRESEARFRSLVLNGYDMIIVVNNDGILSYASPAVQRILGYGPDDWQGKSVVGFVHPDDRAQAAMSLQSVLREPGAHPPRELRMITRNGSWRTVEVVATNLTNDPAIRGVVYNARDVTERRRAEDALKESEERFRSLAEHSPIGIYQTTLDRQQLYLNPAALTIFEASSSDEVLVAGYERFFDTGALQSMNIEHRKRSLGIASNYEAQLTGFDGTQRTVMISGAPVFDNEGILRSVVGTILDISDRKRLEDALRHQAFHDPLTRLANRARFTDRLEHALERTRRSGHAIAVLFLDLDDFKAINDRFGHSIGDLVLVEVARRIEQNLRPGDTAARFGGDEFAILLEELTAAQDGRHVAARVLEALAAPFIWDEKELSIQASIGIAVATSSTVLGTEEVLRNADVAMYAAKSQGKGRFEIYQASMHALMIDRLDLLGDLQRAVERGEFVIHYQPVVDLKSGHVKALEALVRWNHPTRGLLAPDDFIPLAEESGVILALGRWVLETACHDLARWQSLYPAYSTLSVSVNISAKQVHVDDFVREVRRVLAETAIAPGHLILEVTETLMMQNVESTANFLQEIKALGVRLAIDDFGTGYSSLSYLSQFPFDILKIDKSFVDGAGDGGTERELMPAIIDLGRTLGMQIVAEGIERAEQLARLKALECDLGQGFLFARPLTPTEVEALLDTAQDSSAAA